jgi:hypothetical protein
MEVVVPVSVATKAAELLARSIADELILLIETGELDNSPQLLHLKPENGFTDLLQLL